MEYVAVEKVRTPLSILEPDDERKDVTEQPVYFDSLITTTGTLNFHSKRLVSLV